MKYRQQYDSSDCGAACLAMIASHFGINLNIAKIRQLAGTDAEGTSLKGLSEAAKFCVILTIENIKNFILLEYLPPWMKLKYL